MQGSGDEKKTPQSGSGQLSKTPPEPETSTALSKDLALQLLSLMKSVTAKEVTAQTVNAACGCASEIHKILKLNYEMKRNGL